MPSVGKPRISRCLRRLATGTGEKWPLALAPLLLAAGPGAAADLCGPFVLEDVAAEMGVVFEHRRGAAGEKHLPETMGAGVAWLDHDGDGWQDLYLVQSGAFPPAAGAEAANVLFRNLAGRGFAPRPGAGAGDRGYGQGATAADADGDGAPDLYVTNYGPDVLLRNRGDGSFEDATAGSGLGADGWSSSAAFADADGDGDLDLYVTRYLVYDPGDELFCGDPETGERDYCDPSLFAGAADLYYRSLGGGRFEEATAAAGITDADGRGLGVVFTDLDGDLLPEIYVANDLTVNLLFRNRGDGGFEDLSLLSGAAVNRDGRPEAGMGIALADVDGDLDPELVVTNFDVETNTLYQNLGGLTFADASGPSGIGLPSFNRLAFGVAFADFDLDRSADLYVANGHIFERPRRDNVLFAQPDQIFRGDGAGRFDEVRCAALDRVPTVARGLGVADWDNDGDPDLAVQTSGGPARLLRNGAGPGGWLGVHLRGAAPNTEGVGSRAVLADAAGRQVRWVTAGDSYQSSSDRRLLFGRGGLPPAALEVDWRSGRRARYLRPPADRYLVLYEPGAPLNQSEVAPADLLSR